VDVTFTATAEDFARLSLRLEDPDTLFFNRRLLIEGDTDLGLTLKNLLDAVDWDELARRMPLGMGRLAQALRRRTGGWRHAGRPALSAPRNAARRLPTPTRHDSGDRAPPPRLRLRRRRA
jgi:predicted lipid carrier protein YhbT